MPVSKPGWRAILIGGSAVAASIVAWILLRSSPTSPAVPIGPAATFVGADRCAECHGSIAETHSRTGHASTFHKTVDLALARSMDGKTFRDQDRKVTYRYDFDDARGLSVGIPDQFGDRQFPLPFALGSNQHAQTFIGLIPTFDGQTAVLEHRITAYGDQGRLALTPGHVDAQVVEAVENFGKIQEPATSSRCIGCHTTEFTFENGQLRHVLANVQCESCHGPGSAHVAAQERGDRLAAIASLKATTAKEALAQIEACGKCHRVARDIPEKDLVPDNPQLARFQPVGLVLSACFQKSGGMMSCTTCHDPHAPQSEQIGRSEAACLRCHGPSLPAEAHVACPVSPERDCVTCHMPLTEVHRELSYHDHWIRLPAEQGAGPRR